MNNADWEDLTALINNLTAYEKAFFEATDEIINITTTAEKETIVISWLCKPLSLNALIAQAQEQMSSHIQSLAAYFEMILRDAANHVYDYQNPLIQTAIEQSIDNLGVMGKNQIKKLLNALQIIRQQQKVGRN